MIKPVKNAAPWTYIINYLNGEEIVGTFTKTNCQKQSKRNLELKK